MQIGSAKCALSWFENLKYSIKIFYYVFLSGRNPRNIVWSLSFMIIPAIKTPIDCTRSPIIWITAALIFIASPEPPKQPCEWPWPLSSWLWPWLPGTPWECPWPEPIRIKPRTRLKNIAATEIPIMISGLMSSSWSINRSMAEYTNIPVIIFVDDFESSFLKKRQMTIGLKSIACKIDLKSLP